MNGTIMMLHTVQLLSEDHQKAISKQYENGEIEAKQTESGIKYLVWKL